MYACVCLHFHQELAQQALQHLCASTAPDFTSLQRHPDTTGPTQHSARSDHYEQHLC